MLVELICYLMLVETVICLILRLKIRITTHPPHQFHRVAELLGVHGEIHKPLSPQTITLQVPDGKKAKILCSCWIYGVLHRRDLKSKCVTEIYRRP